MRIALLGATGFLGRALVQRLSPHHELWPISRRGPRPGQPGAAADVLDPASLDGALAGSEVVIHSAGMVSHSPELSGQMERLHVEGTQNVLQSMRRLGLRRCVYISTSGTVAVSREMDSVATEDSPRPLRVVDRLPYYRSKLFAEDLALSARDLDLVCLNPSLLLGPGDDPHGQSTRPVRLFLESRIPFPPPGILSCVDVRDVAEAVARAIDHGRPGRRYLLSGANLSWQAFYQRLARLTGRPAPLAPLPERTGRWLRWLPELGREEPVGIGAKLSREELDLACLNWSVDWSRATAELGWRPRDLQETLQDTVSDLTGGRWWVGG